MLLTDNKHICIDQSHKQRGEIVTSGTGTDFVIRMAASAPDVHKLLKTGHIWNNGQEFLTQLQHASLEKLNQTSL